MKAKLREFTVPAWWTMSMMWGGGHTIATDPTKQGWRARRTVFPDVVLVGRPGVVGCFSARPLSLGMLEVTIHHDQPEVVDQAWRAGSYVEGDLHVVSDAPGWALVVMRKLLGAY